MTAATKTAHNESSFSGRALSTPDMFNTDNAMFPNATSETKVIPFKDADKAHALSAKAAGPTDYVIYATRSPLDDVSEDRAVWSAGGAFGNRDGDIYFGDLAAGFTAIKVTAVLTAAASDVAGEVTSLGARMVFSAKEQDAVVAACAAGISTITPAAVT